MTNSLPCSRAMSIALTKARAEAAEKSVGCRMGRSRLDRLTRQSRGSRFLEEVAHRPKDIDVAEDPDQLSGVGSNDRNGRSWVPPAARPPRSNRSQARRRSRPSS